jgi:5-methylcytosine-specific restriction endonuclease McrA
MDKMCDSMTIISDITEQSNDSNSETLTDNIIESLTNKTRENLSQLTTDLLKEKCKEHSIATISKLKKPELINLLLDEFIKIINILKEKKVNELRSICKHNKLKCNASSRKDKIIITILTHYSSALTFKLPIDELIMSDLSKNSDNSTKSISNSSGDNILETLEKQRLEIELKMKDELEKKKKLEEETKRLKDEEDRKIAEEQKKKEKEEAKKKKQNIPKQVRIIVWNHYIGEDIIKHKCLCCKKVTITNTNFDVGHVLSEKNGGTHEINNLRPICGACNHSMGTENMIDFVVKYGLYIG